MSPLACISIDWAHRNNETKGWATIYWTFEKIWNCFPEWWRRLVHWVRSISSSECNYPSDALHIWAENIPVDWHNNKKEQIPKPMFTHATDQYPNNVNKHDIDRVLARGRSETGGLD